GYGFLPSSALVCDETLPRDAGEMLHSFKSARAGATDYGRPPRLRAQTNPLVSHDARDQSRTFFGRRTTLGSLSLRRYRLSARRARSFFFRLPPRHEKGPAARIDDDRPRPAAALTASRAGGA